MQRPVERSRRTRVANPSGRPADSEAEFVRLAGDVWRSGTVRGKDDGEKSVSQLMDFWTTG
jgi:hypothetical protein